MPRRPNAAKPAPVPSPLRAPGGISRRGDLLSIPDLDLALDVRVTVRDVEGIPQIVGLELRPLAPRGSETVLTADLLRRLPLRQLKAAFLQDKRGTDPLAAFRAPERVTLRGPLPAELLDRVAATYPRAVAAGLAPLKEIGRIERVSRATASKYVRRAREAGLLGWPARVGIAGTTGTRAAGTPEGASRVPTAPASSGKAKRASTAQRSERGVR